MKNTYPSLTSLTCIRWNNWNCLQDHNLPSSPPYNHPPITSFDRVRPIESEILQSPLTLTLPTSTQFTSLPDLRFGGAYNTANIYLTKLYNTDDFFGTATFANRLNTLNLQSHYVLERIENHPKLMKELKHHHLIKELNNFDLNSFHRVDEVVYELNVNNAHQSNLSNLKNFLTIYRANREAFSELQEIKNQTKVPSWSLDGSIPLSGDGGGNRGGEFSGGSGGGSGGHYGDSSGGFEPPNNGGNHFFMLIIFGSGLIVLANVLVKYGSQLINNGINGWIDQCSRKAAPRTAPKRPPRFGEVAVLLRGITPLLLSGTLLTGLVFLLTPERLQTVLRAMFNLMAVAAQEVGRAVVAVLPPPMRQVAQYFGRFLALAVTPIRYIIEIVIPLVQLLRKFAIVFCGTFMLIKGITLSVQLATLIKADKAINLAQAIQTETLSVTVEPILTYTIGILKSLSFFILPYLTQIPKCNNVISQLFFFTTIVYLVLKDPYSFFSQTAEKLISNHPAILKMFSCILGRWCFLLIIANIVNQDKKLRRSIYIYIISLYFFKVYQLAGSATPNLFP